MSKPRGTEIGPLLPGEGREALNREPPFEVLFRVLYEERFPMLNRYLHRLSGETAVADDIAQESFVRLYQRGSMPEDPPAWLVSVANNLVRDERRKVVRRLRLLSLHGEYGEDAQESPSPEAEVVSAERVMAVRCSLGKLSLRDRQLLVLHHEGYSYREIADALGIAATSVGTLLVRASAAFIAAYTKRSHASD